MSPVFLMLDHTLTTSALGLCRAQFMSRIVLCVLHFRLGARYVEANPPFTSIEMDYSDSAREGCAVSTLTILSEPCDWRGAVQVPPLAHIMRCWVLEATAASCGGLCQHAVNCPPGPCAPVI